jgi:hypothetical protein
VAIPQAVGAIPHGSVSMNGEGGETVHIVTTDASGNLVSAGGKFGFHVWICSPTGNLFTVNR